MKLSSTSLHGLFVADAVAISDHRGAFSRLFCASALQDAVAPRHIVQINQSRTTAVGAVRGLHYQRPPHAEMKMVRCLRGRVWDVAVDLRAGSPTFLQWHAEELSADNKRMLIIPEGFAHGFQVLEPDSELLYLHTAFYTPAAEGGVAHDEPRLGIRWPLPVTDLSVRDRQHPPLAADFTGIVL
jgi:dTDP-4-dehydrorhamnose 3,5-epimerase